MPVYYNENDAFAAQWLRNLIAAGLIAHGDVDTRSIVDVRPDDVRGYDQCHFFAGIGGWSHALRLAGWPDDRPVWTGSCPCQPFSIAGDRDGSGDRRHLWPNWSRIIGECRPVVVFGEQVATRDAFAWFDFVCSDMETKNYTVGAVVTCAAMAGAPHIRERLYFVAVDESGASVERAPRDLLGDAKGTGSQGSSEHDAPEELPKRIGTLPVRSIGNASIFDDHENGRRTGFWDRGEWILCNDPHGARWRVVEPQSFPLANGVSARMGKLRAYGNAIVAPQAAQFIRATMNEIRETP